MEAMMETTTEAMETIMEMTTETMEMEIRQIQALRLGGLLSRHKLRCVAQCGDCRHGHGAGRLLEVEAWLTLPVTLTLILTLTHTLTHTHTHTQTHSLTTTATVTAIPTFITAITARN